MQAQLIAFPIADGRDLVFDAASDALTPSPPVIVSQWAERHRRLSPKESSKPGRWQNGWAPFAAEIMDVLSPEHPAQRIVFQKSTQVAGTEIGNNWVGSVIATQRCPMMVTQPTIDLGERWSKQRLTAMIESTPALRAKIAPARSRDSGNTTMLKEWDGGVLIISGANSAASLRSMPAKYLFADEVDAYPIDLDGEGDPLSLAEARLSNFEDRKIFICSTPTIESLSVIHKEFKASDQRRYQVPCPHCGGYQALEWEQLHWPEGEPHNAVYLCMECGKDISEDGKPAMLAAGRWVAEKPENWDEMHPTHGAIGFHINAIYSPIGLGLTWGELAADWLRKRKDPLLLKTFVNTKLGICNEDPGEKLDWEALKQRAELYKIRTIPKGCLVLTAGVDVQGDRWAVLVLGHGRDGQKWVIDYVEIDGDPTKPDDWKKLDAYLGKSIENDWRVPLRIEAACIDSGYLQDEVVNFTRSREQRGIYAIKGSSQRGRSIIGGASKVDFTWRGTTYKAGAKQWQVGEDTAKEWIYKVLAADGKEALPSNRRIHFSADLDESFYTGLTAEVYDPNKRRWIKIRPRNEPLDCFGYAIAAARHRARRIEFWPESEWRRREELVQPTIGDLFAGAAAAQEEGTPAKEETAKRGKPPVRWAAVPPPVQSNRRPGGFVRGWRR